MYDFRFQNGQFIPVDPVLPQDAELEWEDQLERAGYHSFPAFKLGHDVGTDSFEAQVFTQKGSPSQDLAYPYWLVVIHAGSPGYLVFVEEFVDLLPLLQQLATIAAGVALTEQREERAEHLLDHDKRRSSACLYCSLERQRRQ